ncbi:hypothetical protein ACLBXB_21895 [Methylobacterium mesophilicum]
MNAQHKILDPIAACYESLRGEATADTCCKRMCVMIRRMQRGGNFTDHESHFMTLANQLIAKTQSFGVYIVEIYTCMIEDDFETAIQIGEAMVQHEALLLSVAAGKALHHGATIN